MQEQDWNSLWREGLRCNAFQGMVFEQKTLSHITEQENLGLAGSLGNAWLGCEELFSAQEGAGKAFDNYYLVDVRSPNAARPLVDDSKHLMRCCQSRSKLGIKEEGM